MCNSLQQKNWPSVPLWVQTVSLRQLPPEGNSHGAAFSYFLLFLFHLRRCLTLFWMRTSWKTPANTLQSTWKHTGERHTRRSARRSTHCWDAIWAPRRSHPIPLPSRWNSHRITRRVNKRSTSIHPKHRKCTCSSSTVSVLTVPFTAS